jgi:hypothetical protein
MPATLDLRWAVFGLQKGSDFCRGFARAVIFAILFPHAPASGLGPGNQDVAVHKVGP